MQLVTRPIDIVKQCVATKREFNYRVAHRNEDCRKNCTSILDIYLRSLDWLLLEETVGKQVGLFLQQTCYSTVRVSFTGSTLQAH